MFERGGRRGRGFKALESDKVSVLILISFFLVIDFTGNANF